MNLDNINFKIRDPGRYVEHLDNYPRLLADAWQTAKVYTLPSYFIKANKFVVLGMGGSGISAEIIKDLLADSGLIIEVVHDYGIPKWVDRDTIVIACSYSGNTEETLSAFFEAYERRSKLIAITGGGKLEVLAGKFNIPTFLFQYASPPRAAFPYLFMLLLSVFAKLGHFELSKESFKEVLQFVDMQKDKFKTTNPTKNNNAKILAQKLYGKLPVIYGGGFLKKVALQFKSQINENSKTLAFAEYFPELDHDAIEGYLYPKKAAGFIMLESNFNSTAIIQRQNLTAKIINKHGHLCERIKCVPCDNPLAEILTMGMFGDYVSYYLALLNGVNPSANLEIDYIKRELLY